MDQQYWDGMRRGDWVIYADQYEGVHRVKIVEIDIKIREETDVTKWAYPYGLTAETGTVKIRYGDEDIIENLANLLAYTPGVINALKKAWNTWKRAEASATAYLEDFLSKVRELNV